MPNPTHRTAPVDPERLAAAIDAEVRAAGGPERAEREKAYLRSELQHHGTPVPAVRAAAQAASRGAPGLTHDELVATVEQLWSEPVHERRLAAIELMAATTRLLGPDDVALIERLLREARTWALVDPLSISVFGPLVERHDELGGVLDRWAVDDDFWVRRSALLSLLVPLRRGDGDWERFCRYADPLLDDREFFVRKAIGWVLRDTGRRRPELVHDWILPRASRASGVTIREAVKPLTNAQRARVLAAR